MACSLMLAALRREERINRSTDGWARGVRERTVVGEAKVRVRVERRAMRVEVYILVVGGGRKVK